MSAESSCAGEQLPGDESEHLPIPEDARPDEFLDAKPTWQKMSIVLAGPAMNLLLPVLIFALMLWSGIPRTLPVIGMVERGSPAEAVGLMPEQRLHDVDMALDETRKHHCIAGVEDVGGTAIFARTMGYGRDAAVSDRDVSLEKVSVRNHRQEKAVPDHEIRRTGRGTHLFSSGESADRAWNSRRVGRMISTALSTVSTWIGRRVSSLRKQEYFFSSMAL